MGYAPAPVGGTSQETLQGRQHARGRPRAFVACLFAAFTAFQEDEDYLERRARIGAIDEQERFAVRGSSHQRMRHHGDDVLEG